MATEEHLRMSSRIKDVHSRLREQVKNGRDFQEVWKEHLSKEAVLQEYAECMKNLATNHWTKLEREDGESSRISWVYHNVLHYYHGPGVKDQLDKDRRRLQRHQDVQPPHPQPDHMSLEDAKGGRIKLLDVGSCYNPFSVFREFEVTAIDIAPAVETVIRCDFLQLDEDKDSLKESRPAELISRRFDVVVFCLLLEYLPTKEARLKCCKTAEKLLRENGILIIITPDSSHATRNSQLYKGWKTALLQIGLQRIIYEKKQHFHGMVFRKLGNLQRDLALMETETLEQAQIVNLMAIPQDSSRQESNQEDSCAPEQPTSTNSPKLDRNGILDDFACLPECDISS